VAYRAKLTAEGTKCRHTRTLRCHFTVEEKTPFDNHYMRSLYETGYQMGSKGVPWKKVPPGL
jgi:hypothetical protein